MHLPLQSRLKAFCLSVALNSHMIFLFGIYCQREDIYLGILGISLMSETLDLKGTGIEVNEDSFAFFHRVLSRLNQLQ